MANDNDMDDAVNQLVDQLQNNTITKPTVKEELNLDKENLEKFLLQYSGKLVKGSIEFVDDIKAYVSSAPDAKEISAVAELIASSAAAIESLNKILVTNKNIDTKFKLKEMDMENKKQMQQLDIQGKFLMNREELLKKLIDDAKIINVESSKEL